jgi:hypothetical protein
MEFLDNSTKLWIKSDFNFRLGRLVRVAFHVSQTRIKPGLVQHQSPEDRPATACPKPRQLAPADQRS